MPNPPPDDPSSASDPAPDSHDIRSGPWYRQLYAQVLFAMVLGLIVGLTFKEGAASTFGWIGDVFVQLLFMVIVPLVLTSLVSGTASIGTGKELGRIGAKTLGYYALSSFLAILTGLFFVNLIKPGVGAQFAGVDARDLPEITRPGGPGDFALRLLTDFIPRNPITAMADGKMLGIIGFSIMLGAAIAHTRGDIRLKAREAFDVGFRVMLTLTGGIMKLLPIGVFGLVCKAAGQAGLSTFVAMGKYMLTIAAGLTVHIVITLPLLLIILGRINPKIHFRNMINPLVTAFSTSSSGVTMPVTLTTVEKKVGVSNRITSFVIPLGATVNMDGTALYECAGVIFIAQALGFPLDLGQQITIVITAFVASVGAAAIPSAGLVMIFVVLKAIGLDTPEAATIVGFMLAIDRPLDMLRTATNVYSDSAGAAIVAKSEGEKGIDE